MTSDHRPQVAAQRRERMRSRLVQAAFETASLGGIAAVTIDAVIAKAEVSRGSFYKYFDTPQALMHDVGQVVVDALLEAMNPLVAPLIDPAERIAVGVRVVLHMGKRYPALAGFLARSGWPAVDLTPKFYSVLGNTIESGMNEGRLSRMPVRLAIANVVGTLMGALHTEFTQAQENDFQNLAAAVVLRGLGLKEADARQIASAELPIDLALVEQALGRLRDLKGAPP